MLRTAALLMSVIGLSLPAVAQDKDAKLPENTIDCNQFKKIGEREWIEVGTAVFDLGGTKDINLTNQPVTPGFFKFGGIDVYPVLDQKCGVSASDGTAGVPTSDTKEQAVITLAQSTADPKAELGQNRSSLASAQTPTEAAANEPVAASVEKIAKNLPENTPCGERKSVYVADGLTDTAARRGLFEIVFNNKMKKGENSEFIIREHKYNELELVYTGKIRQGRFIFTTITPRQRNNIGEAIFASMPIGRHEFVLVPTFVKPNRDGAGEAILYLSGLRALFASKENVRHFRPEGKRPSEPLPETFYFDRCE